jgi:hypothetical protein
MLDVARQVRDATTDRAERLRLWRDRTGRSRATLHRRLLELRDKGELDPADQVGE